MAVTGRHDITLMIEGQTGGEALFNEGMNKLDGMALLHFKDRDLTAPPGGESAGDVYLVKATATGDWAGQDADIAIYNSGWKFVTPSEGMRAWVDNENLIIWYNGSAWVSIVAVADLSQTIAGPSIAEVQAISDKVDELLGAMRTAGLLAP